MFINILSWIIAISFILAALYFVAESIVIPIFRIKYRFQLFALRDELRTIKHSACDEDILICHKLEALINGGIRLMKTGTFLGLIEVMVKTQKHPEIIAENERFLKSLDNCQDKRISEIRKEVSDILFMSIIANSIVFFVAWSIIVIPYILLHSGYSKIKNQIIVLLSTMCAPINNHKFYMGV